MVSTIIPVYNGQRFLAEALQSVLSQNYKPVEIIVVDDGSTDDTAVLTKRFGTKIRYIYQENAGPAAARNHGISLANGEVTAFLDVDDLWSPTKLQTQVRYLVDHPETDIVQGLIQKMQWVNPGEKGRLNFEAVDTPYYFINIGSAVYRSRVFDSVGLFDEKMWENEDTDWYFRAWELNIRKVVLDEVSLYYRIHDANMILSQNLVFYGVPRLLKAHIDRMRASREAPLHSFSDLSSYIGWKQDRTHIVSAG